MRRKVNVNPQYIGGGLADLKQELMADPDFQLGWNIHELVIAFGHVISEIRKGARLTQANLADRLGVDQSFIARLEAGRPDRMPTISTLIRVAKACGHELEVAFPPAKTASAEQAKTFVVSTRDYTK